jgi:cysteine protease ATG4
MKYILGKEYDDNVSFEKDLFYNCYRHNFEKIGWFTDDVGWGCTLRSLQMLIGNVLLRKCNIHPSKYVVDKMERPLSIHNLITYGQSYGLREGEWFYPSIACRCLRDIWKESTLKTMFKVVIYGEDIKEVPNASYPMLMILPVKLGIDKMDEKYQCMLVDMLKESCSMGIIGGSGTSSYYYVGVDSGGKIYYLDPHELRKSNDMDYTVKKVHQTPFASNNPSIALAFFITTEEELEAILEKYKDIFSTVHMEKDENKSFKYVEGDDDFCMIVEDE